jgi:hypothetical protein
MRTLTAVLLGLSLSVTACFAQDATGESSAGASKLTVQLEAPEKWSGETITLPPGFARDMAIKGVEVIRFAPGMFDPQAEDFFSYALVFWLPETKPLTEKQLHDEFLKYYRGLATAVARGRKLGVDPQNFKLKLTAVEKKPHSWRAELEWAEPFRTGQAQTLRFAISSSESAEHNGLLLSIAASPQPHEQAIWKQLDTILKSAKFVSAREEKSASE